MYLSKEFIFFTSILFYFCTLIQFVEGNIPTYAITAPSIIRPKVDYNVIISLHDVESTTFINCLFERTHSGSTDTKIDAQSFTYYPKDSAKIVNLEIGNKWTEGKYTLYINGSGGVNFTEKIDVHFVHKQFVILIQSDKVIYKPGQNVLFRVLVLNEYLRQVDNKEISDMKIYIIDPLDNKLRIFLLNSDEISLDTSIYGTNKFNYSRGVTNDMSFTLHDEAMPGEWKIQAVTRGQEQNYTFFVEYYQLPLANITITIPEYVTYKDPNMSIKVDCFYTFGKPVNGMADILISKVTECGNKIVNNDAYKASQTIRGGQLSKMIDLRDTRLLNPNCAKMKLNVTVVVNDSITGSLYRNFKILDVFQQDLNVQPINQKSSFRPGTLIEQRFLFQNKLGSVNDSVINKVEYITEMTLKTGEKVKAVEEDLLKGDSMISYYIQTNLQASEITTTIKYDNVVILNRTITSLEGCSETFVQLTIQERMKPANVGQMSNLIVKSNKPIKQFIYYIVIRGSIVNASSYELTNPTTDPILLPILLKREMSPEVTIAVFFASPDTGVIVSDAITLQVQGLFYNEVKFDVKTPIVDASEKAHLIIETEPDSRLFFLGVNEAVMALEQGNDIIEKRVLSELRDSYSVANSPIGFLKSGMISRTNAKPECKSYYDNDLTPVEIDDDGKNHKSDDETFVRKDFRETWIWDRMDPPHGKQRIGIAAKVPDSITSWRLTAFSIHSEKGLGLTRMPAHVTVFRPFFIKLNLPYSIKRGEKSEIHILAFNYLNETSEIDIRVATNNTENEYDVSLTDCSFNIEMKPNDIKTLTCSVIAHNVGEFGLLAIASAQPKSQNKVTDAELRSLSVVYEGIRLHKSEAVFFDFTKDEAKEIEKTIRVDYPKSVIKGSQRIFASATSELITTTWKDSLKSMIHSKNSINADFSQPDNCCFQRTINYFPKVYWLDFLIVSKKATPEQKEMGAKAVQTTMDLLCFQNPRDGSFVSWAWHEGGNWHDGNVKANYVKSSVWQTAYTYKLMNHAKKYIRVSPDIIVRANIWLKRQQLAGGEYVETDPDHRIISTAHFGAYLTSYVYIALNSSDVREVNTVTEAYLARLFPDLTHPYDIVITCYALHLAQHTLKDTCFEKVLKMSKIGTGTRYWLGHDGQENLEITAYALMIMVNRKSYTVAQDVFNYLLSKQTNTGFFRQGFESGLGSSLTTIICTEALTLFISTLDAYDPKVENIFIDFIVDGKKQTLHIKPGNEILQSIELPQNTQEVKLVASGYGRSVARIYWEFNSNQTIGNAFNISTNKIQTSGDNYINLDVCTRYNSEDIVRNALMEIDLPTGYTYDQSGLKQQSEQVDRIEAVNGDTHVNVYLKEVSKSKVCVKIPAVQNFRVTNMLPLPIKVYPYYDRSQLTVEHWEFNN